MISSNVSDLQAPRRYFVYHFRLPTIPSILLVMMERRRLGCEEVE